MFLLQENERTKDIIIDQRFHRQIIGTKGEKIREIRDRFNGIQVTIGIAYSCTPFAYFMYTVCALLHTLYRLTEIK